MKTYTYYIYHVPGVKIGCTTELRIRLKTQGFTDCEILWEAEGDYEFGWVAGDKEQELQKEYGYKVDRQHYQISRGRRLNSQRNAARALKGSEGAKQRGSIQGRKNVESGQWKEASFKGAISTARKTRKLTMEDAEKIRQLKKEGVSLRKLAKMYGLSHPNIYRIVSNKSYVWELELMAN